MKSTNPFLTSEYMTKTEVTEHNITETEEITTTKKFIVNNVEGGDDVPIVDEKKSNYLKVNGFCSREYYLQFSYTYTYVCT